MGAVAGLRKWDGAGGAQSRVEPPAPQAIASWGETLVSTADCKPDGMGFDSPSLHHSYCALFCTIRGRMNQVLSDPSGFDLARTLYGVMHLLGLIRREAGTDQYAFGRSLGKLGPAHLWFHILLNN